MGRGPLTWILGIVVGVVVVLGVTALIGNGTTTAASRFPPACGRRTCAALSASGAASSESIVDDIRTPSAVATAGEEPQSETTQGRTGFVRKGLERGVQATETMVEGIDNAGVPDTENGEEAANDVSDWSERALGDLEEAQDSLDDEADSLEEAVEQFQDATGAIAADARRRRTDDHRRRSARSRARSCVPRHEHVSAAPRGEG